MTVGLSVLAHARLKRNGEFYVVHLRKTLDSVRESLDHIPHCKAKGSTNMNIKRAINLNVLPVMMALVLLSDYSSVVEILLGP